MAPSLGGPPVRKPEARMTKEIRRPEARRNRRDHAVGEFGFRASSTGCHWRLARQCSVAHVDTSLTCDRVVRVSGSSSSLVGPLRLRNAAADESSFPSTNLAGSNTCHVAAASRGTIDERSLRRIRLRPAALSLREKSGRREITLEGWPWRLPPATAAQPQPGWTSAVRELF